MVRPIGVVRSTRTEPVDDGWDEVTSSITLDAGQFGPEALTGLDTFSHVEVVYLLDRVAPDDVETGARRPRGNPEWPEVGVFAQRAKGRPNRIGITTCEVLGVEGRTVHVRGLDAIDATPVLDLKPAMREFGPRGRLRQPAWSHELMAEYWAGPAPGGEGDTVAISYDSVAEQYTAALADELATKPLDRALLAVMAEACAGKVVADLGAGPGHVAAHLAAAGVRAVAVDLSAWMCRQAVRLGVPAAAGDLRALPLATASLDGATCLYAVIHLDAPGRAAAYRELARVLRPGGIAVVAFHTADAEVSPGGARRLRSWHGQEVRLTFRFLVPDVEVDLAAAAGLDVVARLDRQPGRGEHPSERTYLLLGRRPSG